MTTDSSRDFPVTNRMVLAIAVPMTLAFLTTPLLGLVDTAVVGQMGDAALLGGLAAGAIVFDVVFSTFNFLRSGTTGLVAQAFGRGDKDAERLTLYRAMLLGLGIGLVIALCGVLIARVGQWFMGADAQVSAALQTYVVIRCLGAPFSMLNYALLGYVLGRGEAGLGLAIQLVLNVGNIIFSILFGLVLHGGVAGVAWGTVTGEALGLAFGLALVLRRFRGAGLPSAKVLFDPVAFRQMIGLNRDIMIRSFALLAVFALFTRQGAQFGPVALAANAVLMNFFMTSAFFLDGFATAAEQLSGRAVGAGSKSSLVAAIRLTSIWGFVLSGLAALVCLVFGASLIGLITTAQPVRDFAVVYLPWAACTALAGVLAFQMDGVFIGATWSREMRNMMLLSLTVFVIALWALPPRFGNHGLWAALILFLVSRGLSLLSVLPAKLRTVG